MDRKWNWKIEQNYLYADTVSESFEDPRQSVGLPKSPLPHFSLSNHFWLSSLRIVIPNFYLFVLSLSLLSPLSHSQSQHSTRINQDYHSPLSTQRKISARARERETNMKGKKNPTQAVMLWLRRQPHTMKAVLAIVTAVAALLFLRLVVHDHDNLFVAAEAVHAIGIAVLIYKLTKEKTCAGYILDL